MKPLDQQLTDLTARSKEAEDAFAAARRETYDEVVARREEARAKAAASADRVDQDLRAAGDAMSGQWNALRAKVAADIDRLKITHDRRQHEKTVDRAVSRADRLQSEAGIAIDVALASIEDAKRAVLDAVVARKEAVDQSA